MVLITEDDDLLSPEELPSPEDKSETESLTDSLDSDVESLAESVGSIELDCSKISTNPEVRCCSIPKSKSVPQFLHFSRRLIDVPVSVAWAIISNHKIMSSMVPGISNSLEYLEGDGGAGSVFLLQYNEKCVKPGDNKHIISRVEVSDDDTKLYALRCLAGKYANWFSLYFTFINVLPDEELGDGSCVIVWRLEYEFLDASRPNIPEDTQKFYMVACDAIRDKYVSLHRVHRPLPIRMSKRMKLLTDGGRPAEELSDPEDPPRRRRKTRVQSQINDEGGDRESTTKPRSWRKLPKRRHVRGIKIVLPARSTGRRAPTRSQQSGGSGIRLGRCSLRCRRLQRFAHPGTTCQTQIRGDYDSTLSTTSGRCFDYEEWDRLTAMASMAFSSHPGSGWPF